jgi:uncharacterized protein YdiU (UPF0061 family)
MPADASGEGRKYPPNVMLREPGAIVCRVSRSFFRFAHLELFAKREEWKELIQLTDFICFREFPHLLGPEYCKNPEDGRAFLEALASFSSSSRSSSSSESSPPSLPSSLPIGNHHRYVEMFRCIIQRVSFLMSEWLRVGYCQGNMNSDNTLLGGRTLDYGPYGWMEMFHPYYQPFTSDPGGNFSFMNQPEAMGVNVTVLGKIFLLLFCCSYHASSWFFCFVPICLLFYLCFHFSFAFSAYLSLYRFVDFLFL